jgi:hypothetical protein
MPNSNRKRAIHCLPELTDCRVQSSIVAWWMVAASEPIAHEGNSCVMFSIAAALRAKFKLE